MSNVPANLKYVASHEWVRKDEDGLYTIGITDHAQELLGDIVFVQLPAAGDSIKADGEIGVVESVKAASDLYSPVTGEVVAVNDALNGNEAVINTDPYGEGWMIRVKLADDAEFGTLLDAAAYQALCDAE